MKKGSKSVGDVVYNPRVAYCRSTPAHCCIHMHAERARSPVSCTVRLACTAASRWSRDAAEGALGSLVSPGPERKSPHAAAPKAGSAPSNSSFEEVRMVASG